MVMKAHKSNVIGIIGFGRMGRSFALRFKQAGQEVVVFDPSLQAQQDAQNVQIEVAQSLQDLGAKAKVIFLLVPPGKIVDSVINNLIPVVNKDTIIIDAGNSNFHDSIRHHQLLSENGIAFLDCGSSGGVRGLTNGFCLMVGGQKNIYDSVSILLKYLAAPEGYAYVGPAGAGHYVKMVHNGIEYALLQAYAEGFYLLKDGCFKELDLAQIAHLWNNGSIIRSFILELLAEIFDEVKDFSAISGKVGHTGMGQWTVGEAHKQNIPVKLIEDALKIRIESQQTGGDFATKLVALLRNKFGGHAVAKCEECKK